MGGNGTPFEFVQSQIEKLGRSVCRRSHPESSFGQRCLCINPAADVFVKLSMNFVKNLLPAQLSQICHDIFSFFLFKRLSLRVCFGVMQIYLKKVIIFFLFYFS